MSNNDTFKNSICDTQQLNNWIGILGNDYIN